MEDLTNNYSNDDELLPQEILFKYVIDLASTIVGLPPHEMGDYLTGEKEITKSVDKLFSKTFGTTPGYFLELQEKYKNSLKNKEETIIC